MDGIDVNLVHISPVNENELILTKKKEITTTTAPIKQNVFVLSSPAVSLGGDALFVQSM